ncbi:aminoacyl-tRNA hydrolase [Legionella sp. CNM-4043-24]|uniref:aminoacyl-tRNA hydrolase n=1 Tax=Legionella sp. CNM-4043-24 TaxID=3421646 RepID=UPI00403B05F0
MTIKLIAGLRNPGPAYENTRHNAGGWFVAALNDYWKGSFRVEKKMHAELASIEVNHHSCKLALPTTFMNLSGLPIREIAQFYRILPSEILIVHDELDLEAGRVKLKTGGGHGGHNGLRDIAANLGSTDFHRLRIGIGHPGHKDQVHDYVLGKPGQNDKKLIMAAIDRAIDAIPTLLGDTMAKAMSQING